MKTRTLFFAAVTSAWIALPTFAQGAMSVAPSGRALTEVTLTLVDSAARAAAKPSIIRIDYGQPHLRGRNVIGMPGVVPWDSVWRTGANTATKQGRYNLQDLALAVSTHYRE